MRSNAILALKKSDENLYLDSLRYKSDEMAFGSL